MTPRGTDSAVVANQGFPEVVPSHAIPTNRVDKALEFISKDDLGIEIGPSHNPIAPKRNGYNVHIIDYLDADQLRKKFSNDDVDIANIEDVDFVWSGQPLPELVGGTGKYDWIVGSHVLEHIPDPVSFFAQCERILRPGGILSLIIPDKRVCFDHFRPLSSTGDLLDAYVRKQTRPSPGSVFEHVVNAVSLDGKIAWSASDSGTFALMYEFSEAEKLWKHACNSDEYMDAHIWRFVPESFNLIIEDLQRLRLSGLSIKKAYGSTGHEFHVALETGGKLEVGTSRLEWLNCVAAAVGEPVVSSAAGSAPRSEVLMSLSRKEERLIEVKRHWLEVARQTAFRIKSQTTKARSTA
jgi:SAM-dependent methyltransferase